MGLIECRGISKRFGEKVALDNVSIDIPKGEIFGLLGSNGSGKTTTIRALLGLYQPTEGKLLINGKKFEPGDNIRIGYLPEERGLYKKETVLDTMIYFGRLRGLKKPKEWSMDYLKRVDMADSANLKISKLSQGMQQKVQLGITIMNDPEILILDEPTKGFDPVNRKLLMQIIEELHQKGSTIVMITHYMEEVQRLCDHILLLKNGTAKAYGTVADVRKKFSNKSLDDIFVEVYGAKEEQYE